MTIESKAKQVGRAIKDAQGVYNTHQLAKILDVDRKVVERAARGQCV